MNKPCPIHGDDCPGDDGGFLIDGNHPDDMFGVGLRGSPSQAPADVVQIGRFTRLVCQRCGGNWAIEPISVAPFADIPESSKRDRALERWAKS